MLYEVITFTFLAEETREWMARLGVKSLDELVGRVDLLDMFDCNPDPLFGVITSYSIHYTKLYEVCPPLRAGSG